jgi:hypothetical protein
MGDMSKLLDPLGLFSGGGDKTTYAAPPPQPQYPVETHVSWPKPNDAAALEARKRRRAAAAATEETDTILDSQRLGGGRD